MSETSSTVLYIDHAGHPAPLSYCFLTQQHLSSSAHRYPPSTVTEVESTFCRNCLSYDAASWSVHCNRPGCKMCPLCFSNCNVEASDGLLYYACGLCDWSSKETLSKAIQDENDKLERAKVLEDLHQDFQNQRNAPAIEVHFARVSKEWERRIQRNKPAASSRTQLNGPWSINDLHDALQKKAKTEKNDGDVPRIAFDREPVAKSKDLSLMASSRQGIHAFQQEILLPLFIPFSTRTSRRCRRELAHGRPGILIKPKLNPLEGDSSLRTGHGQWWKKDASAGHLLPHVRVMNASSKRVLLQVTNPTLGLVRLRFGASNYEGEQKWGNPSVMDSHLEDVLTDAMTQRRETLSVSPALRDASPTQVVELPSSEDSLIELGERARLLPPEVLRWSPETNVSTASIDFLAQNASAAFFDVQLPSPTENQETNITRAVPVALEIEIGNGSWETSMLSPANVDDTWVRFDLLIVNK